MEVIGHLHFKLPVPTTEAGWASEPIWMKEEKILLSRDSSVECRGRRLVSRVFLLSQSAKKWGIA
jgi:uncharacterized protein with PIN domain